MKLDGKEYPDADDVSVYYKTLKKLDKPEVVMHKNRKKIEKKSMEVGCDTRRYSIIIYLILIGCSLIVLLAKEMIVIYFFSGVACLTLIYWMVVNIYLRGGRK